MAASAATGTVGHDGLKAVREQPDDVVERHGVERRRGRLGREAHPGLCTMEGCSYVQVYTQGTRVPKRPDSAVPAWPAGLAAVSFVAATNARRRGG